MALTFDQKKYQLSLKDRFEIIVDDLKERKKLKILELICVTPLFLLGLIADIMLLVDIDRRSSYLETIIKNEGLVVNTSGFDLNTTTVSSNCSSIYNVGNLSNDYLDKRRAYCFFFFLYLVIVLSFCTCFYILIHYPEAMKEYYSFKVVAKLSKFFIFLWNAVPQACLVVILYNLDNKNDGINCLYGTITPEATATSMPVVVRPFHSSVQDLKLVYVLLCAFYMMAVGIYHGYFVAKPIRDDICGGDSIWRSYTACSRIIWYLTVAVVTAIFSFPIAITAKENPVTQLTGSVLTYFLIFLLCLFALSLTFVSVTLDLYENYLQEYVPFTEKLTSPIFYYIINLFLSCIITPLGFFVINLAEFILIFASFYIYYRTIKKGSKLISNSYKFGQDPPPKLDTDGITYRKDPIVDNNNYIYRPNDQLNSNTLNGTHILAMKDEELNRKIQFAHGDNATIDENGKTLTIRAPYYNVIYSVDERLV
ncbi:uncharacterized protein TRIADDRAFT_58440 [Trichoplax adhaerens]|uniref:Uncharacterized protein n=1 Tax=Trichoplax adhaerens TaxID=10228 RepID=B3S2B1_TRIAD|nr:predicted protein [Trichoplax adhaerens]EDV23299.1 predicted protein [Trichoplax adhaerens]|eukprot:XP_002114209.1 predicted protein [Trichoplax adhaerens]